MTRKGDHAEDEASSTRRDKKVKATQLQCSELCGDGDEDSHGKLLPRETLFLLRLMYDKDLHLRFYKDFPKLKVPDDQNHDTQVSVCQADTTHLQLLQEEFKAKKADELLADEVGTKWSDRRFTNMSVEDKDRELNAIWVQHWQGQDLITKKALYAACQEEIRAQSPSQVWSGTSRHDKTKGLQDKSPNATPLRSTTDLPSQSKASHGKQAMIKGYFSKATVKVSQLLDTPDTKVVSSTTHSTITTSSSMEVTERDEDADHVPSPEPQGMIFGSAIATFMKEQEPSSITIMKDKIRIDDTKVAVPPTHDCKRCKRSYKCLHDTSPKASKSKQVVYSPHRLRIKCKDCFTRSHGIGNVKAQAKSVRCDHRDISRSWLEGYDCLFINNADTELSAMVRKLLQVDVTTKVTDAAAVGEAIWEVLHTNEPAKYADLDANEDGITGETRRQDRREWVLEDTYVPRLPGFNYLRVQPACSDAGEVLPRDA